ncbi:histidine kinase [Streptomyces argyrophyllae]|uniref:histidine kinase n=1 Tax=Streptomyces argyrophylli TaxID=2726118 RepID=A0A6M4PC23_9ACTN|nr:ATP-binding protein [Streptomyces argyrophyllae]QJS08472.1 histidine kinase [Streptomyces argyrophyllae]
MTAPTHPGDRPSPRTFVSALAVTGVLSALVVCAAVAAAPDSVRAPLAAGAGAAAVLFSAAVATAAHALRTARGTRRRLESVTQDVGRLLRQQARTAEEARQEQQRLIDELAQQRTEFTESFAAERARLEEEGARELNRLAKENARLTGELERARRDRAAAVAATSNAAARMQALATATLADLRAMEDRHTDEDVLADLLHLDHRTAQAGRLADSVAVLTGARSGRRWARPIGMESILRGAMGRIAGYRRVRVHSVSEAAVAGHAAEGVMHALAELLDNAANFSPPTAEVHVYVEEVPAGVIVSVEDSGLVMGEVQLRRAERAVSGDVFELGGLTGTRLGLAVVGRLARKHGLTVSFRPSARGGTGVLLLIPQEILTSPAPAAAEPSAAAPRPEIGPSAPVRQAVDTGAVHEPAAPPEEGPAGLPRRRRGSTLARAERARATRDTPGHRTALGPADHGTASAPDTPRSAPAPAGHGTAPGGTRQPSAPGDAGQGTATDTAGQPAAPAAGVEPGTAPGNPRHHASPAPDAPRSAAAPASDTGRVRAARFSSFRQAVRPPAPGTGRPGSAPGDSAPDQSRDRTTDPTHTTAPDERAVTPPPDDGVPAGDSPYGAGEHGSPAPSHPHAYPEGDTTS